ncbi:MAG: response regulator, partial [Desulfomonilaceae bacterium]
MSRSRVLVVEDHPLSRRMLETMLKKNYDVISAASGQDAIDRAKTEPPDLVLLDIEMPGLNGFETLEILKSGVIESAVPVIFLTALEDSKSRETGLVAGAVDYITKPYDKQELSIKVKNHLALYEARKVIEARNRVMAREMEMASQLQRSLLPEQFPSHEHIVFSALYKPVSPAGGDFYDVIQLTPLKMGFAEVDVSGHGVASAMVGAMFKMAFQSFARTTDSPAQLLKVINDQMYGVLPDSDFLTVFYGIINLETFEMV